MRLFDTFSESEKQIIRHQCRQLLAHARLFHDEVIPSIPTDEDDTDEVIPHASATMTQQENGWGYNEREFIGEEMPKRTGLYGPGPAKEPQRERKQKKRGAVKMRVTAADIEPKRRPELRGE